jgi:hypothetical protein
LKIKKIGQSAAKNHTKPMINVQRLAERRTA